MSSITLRSVCRTHSLRGEPDRADRTHASVRQGRRPSGGRRDRSATHRRRPACAPAGRNVPWRSNGKIGICRDASLAPDKTRAEIVFKRQTRQRELQKFGIGRYVGPLLCRFDQAGRHPAGQTRVLGLTKQPDGARLLEHEPVALEPMYSSVSVDVRVRTTMTTSVVGQKVTFVQRVCRTRTRVCLDASDPCKMGR